MVTVASGLIFIEIDLSIYIIQCEFDPYKINIIETLLIDTGAR